MNLRSIENAPDQNRTSPPDTQSRGVGFKLVTLHKVRLKRGVERAVVARPIDENNPQSFTYQSNIIALAAARQFASIAMAEEIKRNTNCAAAL